jgi:hypothetical protein
MLLSNKNSSFFYDSSWTGFPLIHEQIANSFTDDGIELADEKGIDLAAENSTVSLSNPVDNNEDVDEVIEYVDVIGNCKNDSPIDVIATSDLNTITIGINDDLGVNFDHRSVNHHFSHDVKCKDVCERQTSSAILSSVNRKGNIELRLALEGLHGFTSVLHRLV